MVRLRRRHHETNHTHWKNHKSGVSPISLMLQSGALKAAFCLNEAVLSLTQSSNNCIESENRLAMHTKNNNNRQTAQQRDREIIWIFNSGTKCAHHIIKQIYISTVLNMNTLLLCSTGNWTNQFWTSTLWCSEWLVHIYISALPSVFYSTAGLKVLTGKFPETSFPSTFFPLNCSMKMKTATRNKTPSRTSESMRGIFCFLCWNSSEGHSQLKFQQTQRAIEAFTYKSGW